MMDLDVRLARGYVGTYQHLDKWMHIGSIDEIGSREIPLNTEEEGDICGPLRRELFVIVKIDSADDIHARWLDEPSDPDAKYDEWVEQQIKRGLHDTYTQSGCHHEYDCCGCRSYHAGDIQRVTGDLWRVVMSSSRNY